MKNALAAAFLTVSFLTTLWIWAFLSQIQWVPYPGSSGIQEAAAV